MEITPRASKRALAQARTRVKKGKFGAGRFLPETGGKNPPSQGRGQGALPMAGKPVAMATPTSSEGTPVLTAWEVYKKRKLNDLAREEQTFRADYEIKTRLVAYKNYLPKVNTGLSEAELTILEVSGETDLSRKHRELLDEALREANDNPEFATRLRQAMFDPETSIKRKDVGVPGSYTGETIIMLHMLYKASREDNCWVPLFDVACATVEYNNDRNVTFVEGQKHIDYPSGGKYGDMKEYAEKHNVPWPAFPSAKDTRPAVEKKVDEALSIGYWGPGYDED